MRNVSGGWVTTRISIWRKIGRPNHAKLAHTNIYTLTHTKQMFLLMKFLFCLTLYYFTQFVFSLFSYSVQRAGGFFLFENEKKKKTTNDFAIFYLMLPSLFFYLGRSAHSALGLSISHFGKFLICRSEGAAAAVCISQSHSNSHTFLPVVCVHNISCAFPLYHTVFGVCLLGTVPSYLI